MHPPARLTDQLSQEAIFHTLQEPPRLPPKGCIVFPACVQEVLHENKHWRLHDFHQLLVKHLICIFILVWQSIKDPHQDVRLALLVIPLILKVTRNFCLSMESNLQHELNENFQQHLENKLGEFVPAENYPCTVRTQDKQSYSFWYSSLHY